MQLLPQIPEQGIAVVIGLPTQALSLEAIARLAVGGEVRVIVGGNRFDAHSLARTVRRFTIYVNQTLGHIQLARPFTCYQTIALFEQTQGCTPFVILDMLTTFYDENITDQESVRLVRTAVAHLQRLGQQAPVLVTLRTPPTPARSLLTKIVCEAADQIISYQPAVEPEQLSIWKM